MASFHNPLSCSVSFFFDLIGPSFPRGVCLYMRCNVVGIMTTMDDMNKRFRGVNQGDR